MKTSFKRILFLVLILSFFSSCQKKCLPPRLTVGKDQTVFAGDIINLAAESEADATYSWTGPNNFSSNEQNPSISNVSESDAGEYTVKVVVDGCENSASTQVTVLPNAPCNPTANTISFIYNMAFGDVACTINSVGRYEITGSSNVGSFRIEFYNDILTTGSQIYKLSTTNKNPNNAFMQIDVMGILSNWQALNGDLYIKIIDNKITATFCGASFNCLQGDYTKKASGKISCY